MSNQENNICFGLGLFGTGVLASGGISQNRNLAVVCGLITLGCFIYRRFKIDKPYYWFKK
jgi:hypothetical protein